MICVEKKEKKSQWCGVTITILVEEKKSFTNMRSLRQNMVCIFSKPDKNHNLA